MVKLSIPVASPQIRSIDKPNLYSVKTRVVSGGETDEVTTHCGFRTIRFDASKVFFLNDKPTRLQGVCDHQDHAGVGVTVPDALWDFRLRKLKEILLDMPLTAGSVDDRIPVPKFATNLLGKLTRDKGCLSAKLSARLLTSRKKPFE
ncbi:MAG: hypothetical protein H8F28_26215 [Fibrella sp.]|nr:hypothetical protein [Armatimonadota bacterium]